MRKPGRRFRTSREYLPTIEAKSKIIIYNEESPKMEHRTGCLICGNELVFCGSATPASRLYCGTVQETNASCVERHYVCDACHSASADNLIEKHCISTESLDPIATATRLMKIPSVKMHGPEHHCGMWRG